MNTLTFEHLQLAPGQVWGNLRLVPIVRTGPLSGLRLHRSVYPEAIRAVQVEHRADMWYGSYIPHGYVLDWGDQAPQAQLGSQLLAAEKRLTGTPIPALARMAKRQARQRLRFLPLHLAVEGFLAQHFHAPTLLWPEYAGKVRAQGLSPRVEIAFPAHWLPGLEQALRLFEIHPGQVGMMLFVADALAAISLFPNPDDYRLLHCDLLQDLYAELIVHYALCYPYAVPPLQAKHAENVTELADLRRVLAELRADLHAFQHWMGQGVWQQAWQRQTVYQAGPAQLERFITPLDADQEGHIGEIIHIDGRLEYLKTFRLSTDQLIRARWLNDLAAHQWHLERTFTRLGLTFDQGVRRLEKAGLGELIRRPLRDQVAARQRRQD